MNDTPFRPDPDRFTGSLIGQCLGDALGFPVEGHSPSACVRHVERALEPGSTTFPSRPPFPNGQYTDDSQLARELMRSLVDRQGFEPEDYARRVASIFTEARIVGRGRATTEAALRLAEGVPWDEAGTPPPAAGNGSAMRAAPIGLFFWGRPEERVRAARDQGRITHADPRCSAGAAAIAGAVARALQPGTIEPERFVADLAREVDQLEDAAPFVRHLRSLPEWLMLSPERAADHIGRAGVDPSYADPWDGISPFVVGSVLWSLWSFLRHPNDYRAAVRAAIAVGGDVDTTAAMTGAISGARVGLDEIPRKLARQVTDRGTWGFDELVALARRCHEIATRPTPDS